MGIAVLGIARYGHHARRPSPPTERARGPVQTVRMATEIAREEYGVDIEFGRLLATATDKVE